MPAYCLLLRSLRSVTGTSHAALLNACGVELAAHNRVLNADVFHAPTAKHHNRVLLEVVPFSGDISRNFHAVGKSNTGDFANSGVWFAGGLGGDFCADAALKGRPVVGGAVLKRIKATRKREDLGLPRFIFAVSPRKLI